MTLPEFKAVTLDGDPACKVKCPGCGIWAYIDDDQWYGKVSIDCPNCSYHETHNFSAEHGQGSKEGS